MGVKQQSLFAEIGEKHTYSPKEVHNLLINIDELRKKVKNQAESYNDLFNEFAEERRKVLELENQIKMLGRIVVYMVERGAASVMPESVPHTKTGKQLEIKPCISGIALTVSNEEAVSD